MCIRDRNTLVVTYLSIIEVHPTEPIFQELKKEDFLHIGGEVCINNLFGTYLVDLQSKRWVDHLIKTIHRHHQILESDGIFLDTIGDLEFSYLPSAMKNEQLSAAVNLLYAIKLLYPNHLLIQNNGLESVCQKTGPFIDGICWENPPLTLQDSNEWVNVITQRLTKLKEKYQLKILMLLEETIEEEREAYTEAKKYAKKLDFLLYNAPYKYVEGINVVKG